MIDLGSLKGLHEHGHQLWAYCANCQRWSQINLGALISEGRGERRLPIRVRCEVCGSLGETQVRPPVPTRGPGGWMEPTP